jgi:N-acetyl sugar amidotransferase
MNYCTRCTYPANAKPGIVFDEYGVCSGCRLIESRPEVDWISREKLLHEILLEHKLKQRAKGNPYDCIIPVSGGKDSTYQVWLLRKKYQINPLLVTYNHTFNTPLGIRNLTNLIDVMDCNLIRFTTAPGAARRLSKYMLQKVGDITWHYHAGIQTFPSQIAVKYEVPLIVWGEEGYSELVGMHNQDDLVEFTKKKRQEHSMRGFEPEDLLNEPDCPVTEYDLQPFSYPSDEDLERVGVRGIYLSNYLSWNARKQTELVIRECGFETAQSRERTFNIYDKLEDVHANGLHDYLKYLKFGYGRATDDAATEIRHGRMTREEGINMVLKYDDVRPSDTDIFLNSVGISEKEMLKLLDDMRDPAIWSRVGGDLWERNDNIGNHRNDKYVDEVKVQLAENREPFIKTAERKSAHCQSNGKQAKYVIL